MFFSSFLLGKLLGFPLFSGFLTLLQLCFLSCLLSCSLFRSSNLFRSENRSGNGICNRQAIHCNRQRVRQCKRIKLSCCKRISKHQTISDSKRIRELETVKTSQAIKTSTLSSTLLSNSSITFPNYTERVSYLDLTIDVADISREVSFSLCEGCSRPCLI